MIATNDLIYLVTNVFYPYILCKFMRAFFGQKGRIGRLRSYRLLHIIV